MSSKENNIVTDLLAAIGNLIDLRVEERLRPLETELRLVKSLQSEWVDSKEALRMTGIKQARTLKAERERPNTALVFKLEGRAQKTARYLRASLLEYNERKTARRIVGFALAA